MPNSEHTAFIATKPLQILVSMTLRDEMSLQNNADLYITETFYKAAETAELIKLHDLGWRNIYFIKNSLKAFQACSNVNYSTIYIDSDVGMRKYFSFLIHFLKYRKININVYEEGLGTYRNDFYKPLAARIFKLLGIGIHFGGCIFTRKIHVYSKKDYSLKFPKINSEQIRTPLQEYIGINKHLFNKIFPDFDPQPTSEPNKKEAILYLASWIWSKEFVEQLKQSKQTIIIKIHPHQEPPKELLASSKFIIPPPNIPAEILITKLADSYRTVHIYHHNSSVARYIHIKNVEYSNLGTLCDFSDLM